MLITRPVWSVPDANVATLGETKALAVTMRLPGRVTGSTSCYGLSNDIPLSGCTRATGRPHGGRKSFVSR